MIQGKKFISPGAWFTMIYPSTWSEFEDGEGSFLFYNPDVWTGNFRISAFKADAAERSSINYGREAVKQELKDNPSASLVKVGRLECAYSKEMFQEEGAYYTTHLWITGIDNVAFECSFTVPKGGEMKEAEEVIATLDIRKDGQKYPAEVIPVRLSEVYVINEGYEWTVNTVKKQLKKDFQGLEEDLPKLQQVIDSGVIGKKKEDWLAIGITVCTILTNEIEGLEWMTLIDGNREVPVLQYKDGKLIDPMKLLWSRVKAGETYKLVISDLLAMSD
ncbi:DUF3805 domain-containing protein [Bacteroides nordii]|jgi:hypothetical protein|uniref:DUF3805 domain-containing protein n=1 Tax=Bacteroides nordii TaxID=291645 RepID=UPI00189E0C21|nr:DUF3805 domain-containing protein [Bacteroides nordii]MBD9109260.1 DUF3805 domain-containing protein [Bacteroides nordii]GFZ39478.1 hypothetical protein BANORC5_15130 [Bacteroides nordii]